MQYACLEVAQCFVEHSFPRVLNSDARVTSMPWEVAPWLAKHFFPGQELAGIKQLAWVHSPSVRGRSLAEQVLRQLPALNIALFADVEEATGWLQQLRPAYTSGCILLPRPAEEQALLRQVVAQFKRALAEKGVTGKLLAASA